MTKLQIISDKNIKSSKIKNLLVKKLNKDQVIRLDDVELNLPKEVIEARDYQYNLI